MNRLRDLHDPFPGATLEGSNAWDLQPAPAFDRMSVRFGFDEAFELPKEYYGSLGDASVAYSIEALRPGNTQVYYVNPQGPGSRDLRFFGPSKVDARHIDQDYVLLGRVASVDPEEIFTALQGEIWSPKGEARDLIRGLHLDHTSMSVGDMVVLPGAVPLVVDHQGFKAVRTQNLPLSPVDEVLHAAAKERILPMEVKQNTWGTYGMISEKDLSRWDPGARAIIGAGVIVFMPGSGHQWLPPRVEKFAEDFSLSSAWGRIRNSPLE